MRSVTLSGPRALVLRCGVPTTRRERARGLLARRGLAADEALLLERCTSVHTFGMAMPIAVARLDRRLVVRDVRVLAPGRWLAPTWRRGHVLECRADADVRAGDAFAMLEPQAGQPPRPAAPVTTHDPA